MFDNSSALVDGIDYKVNFKIEKFNTQKAYDERIPDEVLNLPGNCLTNKGINLIWKAVAGAPFINDGTDGRWEKYFNAANSYIGVGTTSNSSDPMSVLAAPEDNVLSAEGAYDPSTAQRHDATGRTAAHYCYMKMNETYPLSGDNQKIVFQSTYLPGIACFNWYEWCIANGNGNIDINNMPLDAYIFRTSSWGVAEGNDIEDVEPDPIPVIGVDVEPGGEDRLHKTLLNHRIESMGRKYASATWIITVEVSLS